jgi:DNA (cytosine-5)-methyltransferase 1
MNHGSLFSGIGGFDLAAEWMEWDNIFHCEWMPFPRKVLNHYWPNSISYEDITKTDFSIHRGTIDILTGGFPCQPYSSAGKRLGKEDERHLWPHMLRAISEIKPTYVVGENVRGLTNWNGGVVFEEVCTDLESQGYEVQPILLPACAVGAPHRRDRVWFVAYSNSIRQHKCECDNEEQPSERRINALNDIAENVEHGVAAYTKNIGQTREGKFNGSNSRNGFDNFKNFPTQSPICGGDDGLPTELDGITFSKWRNESIKGYGNAIVPQVAYEIFKVIQRLNATV